MDCISTPIPYQQIGQFSTIILDYLNQSPGLRPFYEHPVSPEGLKNAISNRSRFPTNRRLLAETLRQQYKGIEITDRVRTNIDALQEENVFTIVTAHQPNVFTGYLYFIYKILHAVRLADRLNREFPSYHFVPVFYMGSEDADLEELGKIFLNGEKIVWETSQQGAVGRMRTRGLEKMLERVEGQLVVEPHGKELIQLLKECYFESPDLQTATLKLVNKLFGRYGLVVLIADVAAFKGSMRSIFEDDLLQQQPSEIVGKTIEAVSQHYKVQAKPRDINLFYLKDDIRERIVKSGEHWKVVATDIQFSKQELLDELHTYPDRFSPNVILRGLFQETILPNIAFIGGGGETAYWLELKDLFARYGVPFPVLILRNSFLFVNKKTTARVSKLKFSLADIFKEERVLLEALVRRDSERDLDLDPYKNEMNVLYNRIKEAAEKIDPTLQPHVEALRTRAIERLQSLETKMLRAEKRKFQDQQRQLASIKKLLFPNGGLQERVDNFMPYYARYGEEFIGMLYEHSPTLEQHFIILEER